MKIDPTELHESIKSLERIQEDCAKEELMRRYGSLNRYLRTATVITTAIKTSMMTPHEMGLILEALTERICRMSELEPEFESLAHDLSEVCEEFSEAENKRDERLYERECKKTWCDTHE